MTERPLEEIAEEITTLAAHVSAAMCRWLGLVAEFDRRSGWAEWGCKSCAHWLAWRCSLSPATARDHVRVARRLEDLPLIRAAFGRGELSYSKVRALARVEDVEREDELLALATHATAAQLERLVRAYRGVAAVEAGHAAARERRFVQWHYDDDGALVLRGRLPAEEGALVAAALDAAREIAADSADALLAVVAGPSRPAPEVVVHVDVETLAGGAGSTVGVLDDGAPVPAETVRRLCCDAALVPMAERGGRPLSVGRRTRTIPSAIRRALERRDGGCRFPGCQQRRHVDAHHVRHWARGGETSVENLVLLCRHHHTLVHEEGFGLAVEGEELVFRRPDGRRLHAVPRPRRGDPGCLFDQHRRAGLRIDSETSVPRWSGERLELDPAVQALLEIAPVPGAAEPVAA